MRELKPIYKCETFIYTRKETWTAGQKPVTVFRIDAGNLDKWVKQNDGEYIDCIMGCLQDSFLIATRRGYAIAKEHFVNTWTSDFYMIFQPYSSNDVTDLWNEMVDLDERETA